MPRMNLTGAGHRQDNDERIIGQYVKTFPLPEGWEVSGTEVRLDRLLPIKERTANPPKHAPLRKNPRIQP